MPDLLSHVCSGYILGARIRSAGWLIIFLTGVILPDIITRPFYILWPQSYWFVKPFHSPVGIFLACFFFSGWFIAPQRNRVFIFLLLGSGLHLLLDLCQKHLNGGYALAFPFTWDSFDFGFIWPEDTMLFYRCGLF